MAYGKIRYNRFYRGVKPKITKISKLIELLTIFFNIYEKKQNYNINDKF
jgi:hypothetical protein